MYVNTSMCKLERGVYSGKYDYLILLEVLKTTKNPHEFGDEVANPYKGAELANKGGQI